METSDAQSITFSANVGYTIFDVVKYRTEVHDADSTLEKAVRGVLGEALLENDWDTTKRKRKNLIAKAKETLAAEAAAWGITIERIRLTDVARSRNYRHFGSMM